MPSFLFENGSFFPTAGPMVRTPTTGTTVAMPKGTTSLYLTPAGTLAALTVQLPPNPLPGVVVAVGTSATITALTVQTASGGAVAGAPTTLAAGAHTYFQWLNGTWMPSASPDVGPTAAAPSATVTVNVPVGTLAGKAQTHQPAPHK